MNVRRWALERPDQTALVFGTQRWTWRELEAEVAAWTARLASRGIGSDDRVGVLSRNRPEVVFLIHATARLGATLVAFNARLRAAELAPLLALSEPRLVLAEDALLEAIPGAVSLDLESVWVPGVSAQVEPRRETWSQAGTLMFTSGTTGIAKAAHLSRANFDAHVRASAAHLGEGPETRWLACMPLFHVGGRAIVERCAAHGARLVLHEGFRVDAVLSALADEGITHLSVVPTALGWLLDSPLRAVPSTLRAVLVGGGPASPALLAQARSRGWPVLHTYGLTEACSQVCTEPLADPDGGSAGIPLPGTEVRVVDAEGAIAAEGEIEVRGPTVIISYFRNPEATRAAFRDCWFRTRDVGRLDERGRLHILGRRLDLIVSGGENVYPAEVEGALLTHPGLADAAVLGVPDPTWGQVPLALCVLRPGSPTTAELEEWCRARLAGFKVPRRWHLVDSLPRNAAGKLDRPALRALLPTLEAERHAAPSPSP